ncbi:DUF4910 domain-containing protein [Thalassotalea euphylliae]|uniref:DUF4910 domain-containing protein n=1 Tax=Thalassotalea euphylliae TaxID=1655234 RepID=A0A3E0UDA5_9GAMM|nr:DUF4910 domain-containing protein [Thalassotalea euphylliae]REL34810.1 DUF4910 domain-containing protein [Thalassotalea euphylliae]
MNNNKHNVTSIVKKLFPFAYSITGKGNDSALEQYLSELDFTIHEYQSGQSLNGWHIPHAWRVTDARIFKDGQLVYDAALSPLGVGTLSPSFSGELTLAELQQHLVSDPQKPEAIPYHWQNLYRPLELDWVICLPDSLRKTLKEGRYRVELATQSTPSTMKVLDFHLAGETEDTIIINGHNCHPYQANDDISGCAVAIRVIQALQKKGSRKYSYRVIIAPELQGPMFWLNQLTDIERQHIKGCILLKSVGNKASLRLQNSYTGTAELDQAAAFAMQERYGEFEQGGFRTIYGNDETVFEAPPFNIPTISLTRWPFPEYHTDLDTPDKLDESALSDTVDATLEVLEQLECNRHYQRNFKGLVCLSAYGLYKSIPPVTDSGVDYNSLHGRWNKLMNCLPRELENNMSVFDLATKFQLPVKEVFEYLTLWQEAGLLTENKTKK